MGLSTQITLILAYTIRAVLGIHGDFCFNQTTRMDLPPMENGESTMVLLNLELVRKLEVDESHGEIIFYSTIRLLWQDSRLLQGVDFGSGHMRAVSDSEMDCMWVPDIVFSPMKELKITPGIKSVKKIFVISSGQVFFEMGCSIILFCEMDFTLYPLDVQTCKWEIKSFRQTPSEMHVRWNPFVPLNIDGKLGNNLQMSLAQFEITFKVWNTTGSDVLHKMSQAYLAIFMYRNIFNHILVTYFPSSLFVLISWGSFLISPEVVPGRMVLLVTTLLTLVTMFNSIRQNVPGSSGIKPVEVFVMTCIVFVACALLEYATVLFRLRYHRAWKGKARMVSLSSEEREDYMEPVIPRRLFVTRHSIQLAKMAAMRAPEKTSSPRWLVRSEKFSRMLTKGRTIVHKIKRWTEAREGIEDMVSLVVFPVCFVIFNITYWYMCLAWRKEMVNQMENDVIGPRGGDDLL